MAEITHDITTYICVHDAAAAIDFYKRALGASELARHPAMDGKRIMHAEMKIGNSVFMLADEFPEMGSSCKSPRSLGGTTTSLQINVPDVDAAFKRATEAGANTLMPPADMFWGDRYAMITDPFGHMWAFRKEVEKLSEEEIGKRAAAHFSSQKR